MLLFVVLLFAQADAPLGVGPPKPGDVAAKGDDKAKAPADGDKGDDKKGDKGAQRQPNLLELLPYILIPVIVYMFVFGRKRADPESERDVMIKDTKKNDKVLVGGLVVGTVYSIHDTEDEVVVKLDENVRVKFVKGAIHKNYSHDERVKAAKESKEPPKADGQAGTADPVRKA